MLLSSQSEKRVNYPCLVACARNLWTLRSLFLKNENYSTFPAYFLGGFVCFVFWTEMFNMNRTGYIISRVQCKLKMQDSCSQLIKDSKMVDSEALHQARDRVAHA